MHDGICALLLNWRRNKTPPRCSSLSPPLAKASAGSPPAEAYLTAKLEGRNTPGINLEIDLGYEDFSGLYDGSTTKNVDPLPTTDSTQIRPWCASTIDLTIANPRPEPVTCSDTLLAR